jgi:HEPN domain-containing protein
MTEAAESYIELAREDLGGARMMLDKYPRLAAFHIEQAAEKLLKAVLTAEEVVFSAGHHQLGRLAELLPPDHLWRADLAEFDKFTTYATAPRYPRPLGGMPKAPAKEDLAAGIREIETVAGEIEDWCREKLADSPRPKR